MKILDDTPQTRVQVKIRQYVGSSSVQGTESASSGRVINLAGCTSSEVYGIIVEALKRGGAERQPSVVDAEALALATETLADELRESSEMAELFACMRLGVPAVRLSAMPTDQIIRSLLDDLPGWVVIEAAKVIKSWEPVEK